MPAKQCAHGELIALRNPPDQHFVGRSLGRRRLRKQYCHRITRAILRPHSGKA
jgi:hypothetical protein